MLSQCMAMAGALGGFIDHGEVRAQPLNIVYRSVKLHSVKSAGYVKLRVIHSAGRCRALEQGQRCPVPVQGSWQI